jgi:hypothetical protein
LYKENYEKKAEANLLEYNLASALADEKDTSAVV